MVALALAPLSTVQAVLSTGVVMLAVLGNRVFGLKIPRRQWAGVAMTAGGLMLLMVTLPKAADTHHAVAVPALSPSRAACSRWARSSSSPAARRARPPPRRGARRGRGHAVRRLGRRGEGAHAGRGRGPLAVVASPWLLIAIIASVLAFLASARGFQQGDAVPVIACTSTAANVTCILGGILVFGDALAGGMMLAVQLAAFALVAAAALLTPAGHGRVAATAAA